MVESLKMAEDAIEGAKAPPPPGVSKSAWAVSQASWGGKNPLESFKGALPSAPDVLVPQRALDRLTLKIEQEIARDTDSEFNIVRIEYEYYAGDIAKYVTIAGLSPADQAELQTRRTQTRDNLLQFKQDLEQDPQGAAVLEHVRAAALKFIKKVKSTKTDELYGRDKEEMISSGRRPGAYDEVIFEDSPELKALQRKYGGLPTYIFEGIVAEVDKEENNRRGVSLNPLAETEYATLKDQRERDRRREKKYATNETHYGVIYRFVAENPTEFPDAVLDFTKDRIFTLADTDAEGINQEVNKIREEANRLLEQNRTRLEEEGQIIPESNPHFLRAKALADALPDVLGYEKMLYKGGAEFAPNYKKRFASNYFAHDDAIYLENPKAALLMQLLTSTKEGTYWMGHGWDVEKAEEGEIVDYRRAIEEDIVEYAATHELFLSEDDFKYREERTARAGQDQDVDYNLKYSFKDNIEKLLLDLDGSIRADIETSLRARGESQQNIDEALQRHDLRVSVFRGIRESRNEKEGLGFVTNQERRALERSLRREATDLELAELANARKNIMRTQLTQQLQGQGLTPQQIQVEVEQRLWDLMEQQRQNEIRQRIMRKMDEKTQTTFLATLTEKTRQDLQVADQQEGPTGPLHDQLLWRWVKDYNEYRIKLRLPRWYPSGWDRVRHNIDRPTKVLDRTLSEDELMAMFESNPLQQKPVDQRTEEEQKDIDFKLEEARFAFMVARSYQIFHMQDTLLGGMRARLTDPKTGEYIGKLANDDETNKFLGLIKVDAQGNIERDAQGNSIATNPDRKMIRVFDVVQARLEMAISEEAALINQAKAELAAAKASNNQAAINEKTLALRDKMVNAQFIATHAMKEIGLVDGKLPVWSHNFLDNSTIDAFTKVLAAYGVEVAPGVPISHNSKKEFYEIIERGRRALKTEKERAAQEFMAGTYPVFARNPDGTLMLDAQGNPVRAVGIFSAASDWGDPGEISERYRVVSKGAVKENRQITETETEITTSGGMVVTELIPTEGDLGFYPLLVWLAVMDIRGLHGYGKRRDEVEAHFHKFFDVMDPVQHAEAQAAAYNARKALVGGVINVNGKQEKTPGYLKEPFHGAYKAADWLYGQIDYLKAYGMTDTYQYLLLGQEWRLSGKSYSEFPKRQELERLRQMSYEDFDKLSKAMSDTLYTTTYDILDYFQWYLKTEQEVESNRIGRAPRNWEENNTKRWYAKRRAMRESLARGDRGFISRHGYAPEVGNETVISMMETVLADADYLILRGYEIQRRVNDGVAILSRVLTNDERKNGFVIPDEKEWPNQRPEVRRALETIRRRGLLIFMTEEGYKLKDDQGQVTKEILGRKIPALVREKKVNESRGSKMMIAGT